MKRPFYRPAPWAQTLAITAFVLLCAFALLWSGMDVGAPKGDCPSVDQPARP